MTDNYIVLSNERQAMLDAAKAAFLEQGREIEVLPGFQHDPYAPRSKRLDPESVLKRKPSLRAQRAADKAAFMAMANSI